MIGDAIHAFVVEDDKQIRRFLRMALEAEGIAVSEAETGGHALAQISAQRPDLVLLDLGLPDVDGAEVIRQLRTWTDLPVIVLSARSDERQKVCALDAGADDYLTKPFGNAELLARIRAHLRKRSREQAEAPNPIFRFGDVTVDSLCRRVIRNGETVHLTPTEYKLLIALIRSAGKVLTHTQLLREVWGNGNLQRAHYLRIYMGHLRQKLEVNPTRPVHLVTETGIGYRFVE